MTGLTNKKSNSSPETVHAVILRVYDISNGKAATWSQLLLGTKIEGVWHTGILVYGFEYFYGGGVGRMLPSEAESTFDMEIVEELLLGFTRKTKINFESFLASSESEFTPETYNLVDWNCNHFSDICAQFLLDGRGIPEHILDLPETIASSFMGKLILKLFKRIHGSNPVGSGSKFKPDCRVESKSRDSDGSEDSLFIGFDPQQNRRCLSTRGGAEAKVISEELYNATRSMGPDVIRRARQKPQAPGAATRNYHRFDSLDLPVPNQLTRCIRSLSSPVFPTPLQSAHASHARVSQFLRPSLLLASGLQVPQSLVRPCQPQERVLQRIREHGQAGNTRRRATTTDAADQSNAIIYGSVTQNRPFIAFHNPNDIQKDADLHHNQRRSTPLNIAFSTASHVSSPSTSPVSSSTTSHVSSSTTSHVSSTTSQISSSTTSHVSSSTTSHVSSPSTSHRPVGPDTAVGSANSHCLQASHQLAPTDACAAVPQKRKSRCGGLPSFPAWVANPRVGTVNQQSPSFCNKQSSTYSLSTTTAESVSCGSPGTTSSICRSVGETSSPSSLPCMRDMTGR